MESRTCRGGTYSALHTATVDVFGRKMFRPYSKGKKPSTKLQKNERNSNFKNKKIKDIMEKETMIKLENVTKIFRTNEIETLALENLNLEVEKGEFLSIMGPSGCGKSTLLNIMGLLDVPTSGTVQVAGTDTHNMNDREMAAFRNKTLGFVFQSFHLINSLNVIDNVELPLLYRNVSAKERHELAEEVLHKVGMTHRMRHMPTQLSGGQCQRVAIARAIIGNPEIILADEPTGNLDSKMGTEVMDLLRQLNREDGRTIVMVTHNNDQAKLTSRTIRMFDGHQIG